MKNKKDFFKDLKVLMIETGADYCVCGCVNADGIEELCECPHDAIFYGDRECLEYDVRKILDNGAKAVYVLSLHS